MSLSPNMHVAIIYHSGRHFVGPDGVQFEGKSKMMKIKRGTTYHELKQRIYQKLGLHGSQCINRLIAKVETIVGKNSVYYISNDVCDDEDLECVIDAFANGISQNYIEIYVEVESGESSSVPMHTSSEQYFDQEEIPVGLSGPSQVLSQIALMYDEEEDEEDEEDENMYSEDEGEYESFISLGDTSDTDVEGDFDPRMTAAIPRTETLSALRVDPVRSGKLVNLYLYLRCLFCGSDKKYLDKCRA